MSSEARVWFDDLCWCVQSTAQHSTSPIYFVYLVTGNRSFFPAAVREEEMRIVGLKSILELPPELKQQLKCKSNLRLGKTHLVLTQVCVFSLFQMVPNLENFYSYLGLMAKKNWSLLVRECGRNSCIKCTFVTPEQQPNTQNQVNKCRFVKSWRSLGKPVVMGIGCELHTKCTHCLLWGTLW